MTDEITFFKVLLYKHANEANALLRANYDGLETAIVRYLSFIDKEPLIQAFICDCVQEHLPAGFNPTSAVDQVCAEYGTTFAFPPSLEGECGVVYLILKDIVARKSSRNFGLLYKYGGGSTKYDDMTSGFLNEVAFRLVNGVKQALTIKGIELGLDSSLTQINTFNNEGAAIVAQSSDSSTISITQTNGINRSELESLISKLRESLNDLPDGKREQVSETLLGLKEELQEKNPKPSVIRSLWTTIKGFNDCASFAKNAASLGFFLSSQFPWFVS